jgi:hypothetical protein
MQYVLGNMLNGAGGLNADGLSLDLQFAADKTLTARKGPTPVFTRGSTGTFVGSNGLIQSAAINAARFDHTSAGVCRGLLIEESRTNLTVRSDDFGASEWNAALQRNLTVTANNTASPSGATDADLLTVGATTTAYQVVQSLPATGNVTSGTAYTVSCYFKPNQVTRVSIWAGNSVTLPVDAMFDLTGAGSVVANAFGTASIQQVGNGWYRCIVTGTAGATSSTTLRFSPVSGTSRTYVGNSVDSFWAWGAQLEAGSFATSYIPTTTGSVVRSADVCSITGANFTSFYNQSEGTALVKTIGGDATGSRDLFRFESASAPFDNIFIAGYNRFLAAEVSIVTNNAQQLVHFSSFSRGYERLSLAYAQNNAAFSRNGSITATDNSVVTSSSIIRLLLGNNGINGCISSFSYYKKRLPNIKLNSLTAS